jgi:hypothetical protein
MSHMVINMNKTVPLSPQASDTSLDSLIISDIDEHEESKEVDFVEKLSLWVNQDNIPKVDGYIDIFKNIDSLYLIIYCGDTFQYHTTVSLYTKIYELNKGYKVNYKMYNKYIEVELWMKKKYEDLYLTKINSYTILKKYNIMLIL